MRSCPVRLPVLLALIAGWLLAFLSTAMAQEFDSEAATRLVEPPYQLGESFGPQSWELNNLDGRLAGYAFATVPRAPLPGFSGAPINLFVQITTEGRFIDVDLIAHNEPIFVSGLGEAPFNAFVAQYRGHSITDTLVVGVPYGDKGAGSSLVYLDGVTKATASVRIAHESILAAAFAVAREKMEGLAARVPSRPNPDHEENLTWQDLVDQGLATRRLVTNAEVDAAFKGTLFEDDDEIARANPVATRPGTRITYNGIAQGFAADRVLETLTAHGMTNVMVDAGEFRTGHGTRRIGIENGDGKRIGAHSGEQLAVATSSATGYVFVDGSSHIIDPRAGHRSPPLWKTISVRAQDAATADGLSAALMLTQSNDALLSFASDMRLPGVIAERRDGSVLHFVAS